MFDINGEVANVPRHLPAISRRKQYLEVLRSCLNIFITIIKYFIKKSWIKGVKHD